MPKVAPSGKPTSNASPYFFIAPYLGKWTWDGDQGFEMELAADGGVRYGPLLAGRYRLLDKQTLELALGGVDGQFKGQQLPPLLFRMEFHEEGRILVLRNGGAMLVMRRTP